MGLAWEIAAADFLIRSLLFGLGVGMVLRVLTTGWGRG